MPVFEHVLETLAIAAVAVVAGGVLLALLLRRQGLRWTWAALGFPAGSVIFGGNPPVFLCSWAVTLLACVLGAVWHRGDLATGADIADHAHSRLGFTAMVRRSLSRLAVRRDGWIRNDRLIVGRDERGMPVSIPGGGEGSGSHTLVVGATGSGKTVTQAWIVSRMVEHGCGAVVIDPKGDRMLREQLHHAAESRGVGFLEWTPEGPLAYNPYAQGTDTEIADKALSGETFTEPHYLRQAQRYLGHAVRVMRAAGIQVSPVSLMRHLDPLELEVTTRRLAEEEVGETLRYLDVLSDRQRRDLAGVRDRLSILAESDTRQWLDPTNTAETLDVHQAVAERAVVYFRLDADRRPLLSQMLAGAIVSDLITLVARLQSRPVGTVVVIDEFSAVAADQVARLFGRARSAGISLVLGTQELADLRTAGEGLREQTLGNVAAVVAHRQNVPESAELIAEMAGTKPVWVTTQQTDDGLLGTGPSGRGSRRRGYEFEIHPSRIKRLATGQAVVITPGSGRPAVAWMCHAGEPRR
jgi:conjugal transfer pilus assembly protein TraD